MRFATMAVDGLRRPVIPVVVESADGRRLIVDALIDTGSDLTLFPETVADALGINLDGRPEKPLSSALGVVASYREYDLTLELRRDAQSCRWRASVGFVPRQMVYSILGTRGFFELMEIAYNAHESWVDVASVSP